MSRGTKIKSIIYYFQTSRGKTIECEKQINPEEGKRWKKKRGNVWPIENIK